MDPEPVPQRVPAFAASVHPLDLDEEHDLFEAISTGTAASEELGRLRARELELVATALDADDAELSVMMANMYLVATVVRKHQGQGVSAARLFGAGVAGLAKAVAHFDPAKGFRFSNYAHWWIKREMVRSIEAASPADHRTNEMRSAPAPAAPAPDAAVADRVVDIPRLTETRGPGQLASGEPLDLDVGCLSEVSIDNALDLAAQSASSSRYSTESISRALALVFQAGHWPSASLVQRKFRLKRVTAQDKRWEGIALAFLPVGSEDRLAVLAVLGRGYESTAPGSHQRAAIEDLTRKSQQFQYDQVKALVRGILHPAVA